jgi:hypothetical protein
MSEKVWYYCLVNDSGRVDIKKVTKQNLTITKEYRGFAVCGTLDGEDFNTFFTVHFNDFDKTLLFELKDCSEEWIWISNSRECLVDKAKDFFMDEQLKWDRGRYNQEKVVEEELDTLKYYKKQVRIFERICNKLERI